MAKPIEAGPKWLRAINSHSCWYGSVWLITGPAPSANQNLAKPWQHYSYQQCFVALAPVQPSLLPGPNISIVTIPAPPVLLQPLPHHLLYCQMTQLIPSHIKIGPLGQIVRGSSAAGGFEEKAKEEGCWWWGDQGTSCMHTCHWKTSSEKEGLW